MRVHEASRRRVTEERRETAGGRLRRARIAATVAFVTTGAVFAPWASRIPTVQERLDLDPGALAIALLGLEAGAIVGLAGGGWLVAHVGPERGMRVGFACFPPAMFSAAVAPSLAWLTVGLASMGAANSVVDIAINAHGVELERRFGRPLLSGLHSGHSFGVLGGGLTGTALAAAGVSVVAHFAVAAAGGIIVGQAASRALLRQARRGQISGPDGRPRSRRASASLDHSRRSRGRDGLALPGRGRRCLMLLRRGRRLAPKLSSRRRRLALLGLVAWCAFFVEGAANDWSAVHVRSQHGASPALAAAAFATFSLALALGRLAGDRIVARHGRTSVVRACGLVAAAGAGLVALAPSAATALAGWGVLGAGVAALAPTVLGAAPLPGDGSPARAIAAVTTVGYAGSFAGPPVIGALAGVVGLSAALGSLAVGSLAIVLLAGRALGGAAHRRSPRAVAQP